LYREGAAPGSDGELPCSSLCTSVVDPHITLPAPQVTADEARVGLVLHARLITIAGAVAAEGHAGFSMSHDNRMQGGLRGVVERGEGPALFAQARSGCVPAEEGTSRRNGDVLLCMVDYMDRFVAMPSTVGVR
jgi:hypothetical protein